MRLLAAGAASGQLTEAALGQLDGLFLLASGDAPTRAQARALAKRWLAKVPPADRARLRAHLYLWSGGR